MTTATIVVIPTDLKEEKMRFETVEELSLKKMQELVGGYVEALPMGRSGCTLLFDEEGLLKGTPVNDAASDMIGYEIVGQAVVVGVEGAEWVSIPDDVKEDLQKIMDMFN